MQRDDIYAGNQPRVVVKIEEDDDNNQDDHSEPSASNEDEQKYFEKLGELREKLRLKWRAEEAYRNKREQVRKDEQAIEDINAASLQLKKNIDILSRQREAIEEMPEIYQYMLDHGVKQILQIRKDLEAEKSAAAKAEDREVRNSSTIHAQDLTQSSSQPSKPPQKVSEVSSHRRQTPIMSSNHPHKASIACSHTRSSVTTSEQLQDYLIDDHPSSLSLTLRLTSLLPEMSGNTRRSKNRAVKPSNKMEPIDDWKSRLTLVEKHLQSVDDEIRKEQVKLNQMAAKAVKVAKMREDAEDIKFGLEQEQKEDVELTHFNNDSLDDYKAFCHLDAERDDLDRQLDFLSMGLLWPKSKGRFRKMRDELRRLWEDGEDASLKYNFEKIMQEFAEANEIAKDANFDLNLDLGKPEVTEDELSRLWARED
ncbi:hypothetical protein IWZ01DRAFT_549750 [Phyllosticta capitalensis]